MSQWQNFRKLTREEISAQGLKTQQAYYEGMKDLKKALTNRKEVVAQVQAGILWGENRNGGHSAWATSMDDQHAYIHDRGNTDIGAGGKIPIDRFNEA